MSYWFNKMHTTKPALFNNLRDYITNIVPCARYLEPDMNDGVADVIK